MADITITHTPEEGTLLTGSTRGDGVWEIARQHGFTYRRNPGIFIRGSRDRKPQTWHINAAKAALEAAGHTVELNLDEQLRSAAEREEALAERLEDRRDALEAKADRRAGEAAARLGAARQTYDMIPLGQPILVGHHSEARHRRDLARAENNMRKGMELDRASTEAARKAEASRTNQSYRETGPVTERRIAKLEADERRILRDTEPCVVSRRRMKPEAEGRTLSCPRCYNDITIGADLLVHEHGRRISQAHGEQLLAEVRDELGYWRTHLQELIDSGRYRKWGPDDFEVGDYVRTRFGRWSRVEKINRKTLSVPSGYSWLDKILYDEVLGRRSKAEQKGEEETA